MYNFLSLVLPTVLLATSTTGSSRLSRALEGIKPVTPSVTEIEVVPNQEPKPVAEEVTVEEPVVSEPAISCVGCNSNETETLEYLWDYGIKDRVALATIMGNIKQESNFYSNICEGGARVPYNRCYSGGYGLIQWTSINRYRGLGSFAAKIGGDPSTLETQLKYMVTEVQWQAAAKIFERPGLSVSEYMRGAYIWLGWGIHGNRTYYSNQYINKIQIAE